MGSDVFDQLYEMIELEIQSGHDEKEI